MFRTRFRRLLVEIGVLSSERLTENNAERETEDGKIRMTEGS